MKFNRLSNMLLLEELFIGTMWITAAGKVERGDNHWQMAKKFFNLQPGTSAYGKTMDAGWIRVDVTRGNLLVNFIQGKPTAKAISKLEDIIFARKYDDYILDISEVSSRDGNETRLVKAFSVQDVDEFMEKVNQFK